MADRIPHSSIPSPPLMRAVVQIIDSTGQVDDEIFTVTRAAARLDFKRDGELDPSGLPGARTASSLPDFVLTGKCESWETVPAEPISERRRADGRSLIQATIDRDRLRAAHRYLADRRNEAEQHAPAHEAELWADLVMTLEKLCPELDGPDHG